MPTVHKMTRGDFVVEDSTARHARIGNVRSKLKNDIYGEQFIEITLDVQYESPLSNDTGQGMILRYEAYDSKGFLVDGAPVFMQALRLGQKGRGEIQLKADKVDVSFFGRFRVVV